MTHFDSTVTFSHSPSGNPAQISKGDESVDGGVISELARALSQHFEGSVNPGEITRLPNGITLEDSTTKLTVSIAGCGEKFILLSGAGNPALVQRACENIKAVRACLPPPLKSPVLAPDAAGIVGGLSYAVWPRHTPLSRNRIIHALEKRRLTPRLFDWLYDVCRASMREPLNAQERRAGFEAPLEFLQRDSRQCVPIRKAADAALQRLTSGQWSPYFCIQHSDFWFGNILKPARRRTDEETSFFIIDWGGARLKGYPLIDMAQLSVSLGAGRRRYDMEAKRYGVTLDCAPDDMRSYLLCALGALGGNLEYFPEDRYLGLCDKIARLARII